MSEDKNNPEDTIMANNIVDPNTGPTEGANGANSSGEAKNEDGQIDLSKYVDKETYEELEKKLSDSSQEIGEYRNFYRDIEPLLEKLRENPDVATAILDGRINEELLAAMADGKIDLDDATKVADAHKQVKDSLGKKKYEKASSQELENLVSEKIAEIDAKFEKKANDIKSELIKVEEQRATEKSVGDFVATHDDFADYADDIVKMIDEHPEITDIEVAYNAVKGKTLSKLSAEEMAKKVAESRKGVAANVAGGGSANTGIETDQDIVDSLIVGQSNPNL